MASVMLPGQRIRQTRWRPFNRVFTDGSTEQRFIREAIYGTRRSVRYFQLTTDPVTLPPETTWDLMTNLPGTIEQTVGNTFGLRTWIEYGYLADYAGQHGGKLLLHESVQDVTNDYVDTQSRLANLRSEQQRLQALMGKASSLADVLTIEQRLTDVEGQIESIEAHLNALTGQVTFYSITLNLTPTTGASSPATPSPSGWNTGQTLHDALLTALAFAEWLATIGIWVVVFSVFVVPAGLIVRVVMRWRARRVAPAR